MGKQIIMYQEFENASGQLAIIALHSDGSAIASTDEAPERLYRNYDQAVAAVKRAGYYKI